MCITAVPALSSETNSSEYGMFFNHDERIEEASNVVQLLKDNAKRNLKELARPHGWVSYELNSPRGSSYVSGWRATVYA